MKIHKTFIRPVIVLAMASVVLSGCGGGSGGGSSGLNLPPTPPDTGGEPVTAMDPQSFLPSTPSIVSSRSPGGGGREIEKTGGESFTVQMPDTSASPGDAFIDVPLADSPINIRIGGSDAATNDDHLAIGIWTHDTDGTDRGGFAVGANFNGDLPASGDAAYSGNGIIAVAADDFYHTEAEFTVGFDGGGAHTLAGTLTEFSQSPKFALRLLESTFLNGGFSGELICANSNGCEFSTAGDTGEYDASFFGTPRGRSGSPAKIGGTFKAANLALDNKPAANVVGAFEGLYVAPPVCENGCVQSFWDTQPAVAAPKTSALTRTLTKTGTTDFSVRVPGASNEILEQSLSGSFYILEGRPVSTGFAFYSVTNPQGSQGSSSFNSLYWGGFDFADDSEYLVFGSWRRVIGPFEPGGRDELRRQEANDRGGFAVGAKFNGELPTGGSATYSGRGSISGQGLSSFETNVALNVEFSAHGAHAFGGIIVEDSAASKFALQLENSIYGGGGFSGAVSCANSIGCAFANPDNKGTYEATFFGTAGATGTPGKIGGSFIAGGLSLDGKAATNIAGGFGAELQ